MIIRSMSGRRLTLSSPEWRAQCAFSTTTSTAEVTWRTRIIHPWMKPTTSLLRWYWHFYVYKYVRMYSLKIWTRLATLWEVAMIKTIATLHFNSFLFLIFFLIFSFRKNNNIFVSSFGFQLQNIFFYLNLPQMSLGDVQQSSGTMGAPVSALKLEEMPSE